MTLYLFLGQICRCRSLGCGVGGVGGSNCVMRKTPVMRLDWLAAASRNMEGKYWRESRFRCDANVNEQVIGLGFI